jgi:hypothetical protein
MSWSERAREPSGGRRQAAGRGRQGPRDQPRRPRPRQDRPGGRVDAEDRRLPAHPPAALSRNGPAAGAGAAGPAPRPVRGADRAARPGPTVPGDGPVRRVPPGAHAGAAGGRQLRPGRGGCRSRQVRQRQHGRAVPQAPGPVRGLRSGDGAAWLRRPAPERPAKGAHPGIRRELGKAGGSRAAHQLRRPRQPDGPGARRDRGVRAAERHAPSGEPGDPRPRARAAPHFTAAWRTAFRDGVLDHRIKELCRLYVSRTVDCRYYVRRPAFAEGGAAGRRRGLLRGSAELPGLRPLRRARADRARLHRADHLEPRAGRRRPLGAPARPLRRARDRRAGLLRRSHQRPAALDPHARHRAQGSSPTPTRAWPRRSPAGSPPDGRSPRAAAGRPLHRYRGNADWSSARSAGVSTSPACATSMAIS